MTDRILGMPVQVVVNPWVPDDRTWIMSIAGTLAFVARDHATAMAAMAGVMRHATDSVKDLDWSLRYAPGVPGGPEAGWWER